MFIYYLEIPSMYLRKDWRRLETAFRERYFVDAYIYSFHNDFCDLFEDGIETRPCCQLLKPLYSMRKFNNQSKFEQIDIEKQKYQEKLAKRLQNKLVVKGVNKFIKEKQERNKAMKRKGKTHKYRVGY